MSAYWAAFLKPGKTAWVLYDPDDHSKVTLDSDTKYAEMLQQSKVATARALQLQQSTEQTAPAPPGWYPDPSGAPGQCYWDGRNWIAAQPSVPATAPVPEPGSEIAKLKDLADLRDRGVITQAEFEAEKAKLLNR